jgi:hypothetical protein
MYFIIYKITNQLDGKFYIGSHKTKNINDDYMGSGKYLKLAQKKYGIENFKKEILYVFDTVKEMYDKESEIVNEDFLISENTYNLKVGGYGGWDFINSDEEFRTLKNRKARANADIVLREKYGVSNPGQLEHVKLKSAETFRKLHSEGRIQYDTFRGKKHSDETKKKIGSTNSIKQSGVKNSQYGTMWITDGVENKKIKKDNVVPQGWYKGRV